MPKEWFFKGCVLPYGPMGRAGAMAACYQALRTRNYRTSEKLS